MLEMRLAFRKQMDQMGMALSDAESKVFQIFKGDNQVMRLLNLERKVTTVEEAQVLIVHMRDALISVFSEKRKVEADIEGLRSKIEELVKEKVGFNDHQCI